MAFTSSKCNMRLENVKDYIKLSHCYESLNTNRNPKFLQKVHTNLKNLRNMSKSGGFSEQPSSLFNNDEHITRTSPITRTPKSKARGGYDYTFSQTRKSKALSTTLSMLYKQKSGVDERSMLNGGKPPTSNLPSSKNHLKEETDSDCNEDDDNGDNGNQNNAKDPEEVETDKNIRNVAGAGKSGGNNQRRDKRMDTFQYHMKEMFGQDADDKSIFFNKQKSPHCAQKKVRRNGSILKPRSMNNRSPANGRRKRSRFMSKSPGGGEKKVQFDSQTMIHKYLTMRYEAHNASPDITRNLSTTKLKPRRDGTYEESTFRVKKRQTMAELFNFAEQLTINAELKSRAAESGSEDEVTDS